MKYMIIEPTTQPTKSFETHCYYTEIVLGEEAWQDGKDSISSPDVWFKLSIVKSSDVSLYVSVGMMEVHSKFIVRANNATRKTLEY